MADTELRMWNPADDDDLSSDDFDSISTSSGESEHVASGATGAKHSGQVTEHSGANVKHLMRIREALGLTDEAILKLKEDSAKKNTPALKSTSSAKSTNRNNRPPPEIVVFDDPEIRMRKAKESKPVLQTKPSKVAHNSSAAKPSTGKLQKLPAKPLMGKLPAKPIMGKLPAKPILGKLPAKPFMGKLEKQPEGNAKIIDLKQARHDVKMLGISGLDSSKKQSAIVETLVKLGAKAPSDKTYVNYKEYQKIARQQKREQQAARDAKRRGELVFEKVEVVEKKKRKKDSNDVGRSDGMVGKYKGGVQFINPKQLSAFQKSLSGSKPRH